MLVNHKNITLTLFLSLLLGVAAGHEFPARQHHDALKRLVRKRQDGVFGGAGIINVVPNPNSDTDTATQTTSGSATGTDTTATDTSSTSATSATDTTTSSASDTTSQSSSSSSTTTTSSESTTSTESTTTSSESTTPAPETTSHSTATVVHTASVTSDSNNQSNLAGQNGATSQSKSTIMTIIIVIAASVGGVAILWTVFRKWKLGASKKFDERMAPIDWQPEAGDGGFDVPIRRSASRASSNENHYTAPSANLAAVGGYADLTRGPSPQPQMQESLNRGPSFTRGNYGATQGLPLHHQNNFGQAEAYDYEGRPVQF